MSEWSGLVCDGCGERARHARTKMPSKSWSKVTLEVLSNGENHTLHFCDQCRRVEFPLTSGDTLRFTVIHE